MKANSGITLMETVVAMAIIAVLTALVLTAFGSSMLRAKETVCISNLRQIHAAMELYQGDYGSYPPMSEKWPGLLPYFGNRILECPLKDVADPNSRPDLRVSYFLHAFFNPPFGGMLEDEECMRNRAGSYPIAHDANHASVFVAYRTRRAIYIILRQGGSIDTRTRADVDRIDLLPFDSPCPGASWWSNL